MTLTPDESMLLDLYREAPEQRQKIVIGMLMYCQTPPKPELQLIAIWPGSCEPSGNP